MYYYGNSGGGCCNYSYQTPSYQTSCYPMNYCYGGNNNSSSYAIILVLFILLVVIIGCRFGN